MTVRARREYLWWMWLHDCSSPDSDVSAAGGCRSGAYGVPCVEDAVTTMLSRQVLHHALVLRSNQADTCRAEHQSGCVTGMPADVPRHNDKEERGSSWQ